MYHEIFLIVLALIWVLFASIQDLKKRMVSNWLNFSLIIFALGFRFFYSLFESNSFAFFYQGLIGLGIFFVIGNLLYYGKLFAGGDAKLMIALGAVLPLSDVFLVNLRIFALFFLIFFFVSAIYGIIWSIFLVLSTKNFKVYGKEFRKRINKNKKIIYLATIFGIILAILGFLDAVLFYFGILIFILPYLYIYAKTIDDVCLVKNLKTSKLEEGDWLYKDLRINKKLIKADWSGLSKTQIKEIRKKYKVIKIRQGIPFIPVFLISFLIFVYLYLANFQMNFLF